MDDVTVYVAVVTLQTQNTGNVPYLSDPYPTTTITLRM